jgi:hypothetical protein
LTSVKANRSPAEPAPDTIDPEELVDNDEAATILRQKPQTLAAWRCDKKGPTYIKVGRRVFYQRSAIAAFLAASVVVPGAQ